MYIAFLMKPWGDIDEMKSFRVVEEVDAWGRERTSYSELDPVMDDPDHWEKYDPPVVIVFEAENTDAYDSGKYQRPFAIYQRGKKFPCSDPADMQS
jgi:hypothetical protein